MSLMPRPMPRIVECGCCGKYHMADYIGDCRNDEETFLDEDEALLRLGVTTIEVERFDYENGEVVEHFVETWGEGESTNEPCMTAASILVARIKTFSATDRYDVLEAIKDWVRADDERECAGYRLLVAEILRQEPLTATPMELT